MANKEGADIKKTHVPYSKQEARPIIFQFSRNIYLAIVVLDVSYILSALKSPVCTQKRIYKSIEISLFACAIADKQQLLLVPVSVLHYT